MGLRSKRGFREARGRRDHGLSIEGWIQPADLPINSRSSVARGSGRIGRDLWMGLETSADKAQFRSPKYVDSRGLADVLPGRPDQHQGLATSGTHLAISLPGSRGSSSTAPKWPGGGGSITPLAGPGLYLGSIGRELLFVPASWTRRQSTTGADVE